MADDVVRTVTYTWRSGALPPQDDPRSYGALFAELSARLTGAEQGPTNALQAINGGLLTAAVAGVFLRSGARLRAPSTARAEGDDLFPGLVPGLQDVDRLLRTGPPVWITEPFVRLPLGEATAPDGLMTCRVALCLDLSPPPADERAPLIVEDGTGRHNTNSYCSVEQADAFSRRRPDAGPWFAASRGEKERALQRAARHLDDAFRWHGVPAHPVVRPTTGQLRVRELMLTFSFDNHSVDVVLAWDTDTRTPRSVLQRVAHHADVARVFFPPASLAGAGLRTAVDDMLALTACYLLQARVLAPSGNDAVGEFLHRYVRRFRGVAQSDAWSILGSVYQALTAAQDFRGFRKYVAQTVRGLNAQRRDRATIEHPPDSVHGVADRIGCSPQALYYQIQHGQIRTEKRDGVLIVPPDEIERLEAEMAPRLRMQQAIRAQAAKRGVTTDAVRKRLRRRRLAEKNGRADRSADSHTVKPCDPLATPCGTRLPQGAATQPQPKNAVADRLRNLGRY